MAIVKTERKLVQPTDKNLVYKCHIQSRDDNRNNLKTYVYRQTTTPPQILTIEQKNRIKLSLAIVSIECHVPSRDNNGDD